MTPADLLNLWEQGENRHPLDRALLLLGYTLPEISADDLAALSVGQRDARLLALRQRWFGERLEGFATCPHCGDALEFALHLPDLEHGTPAVEPSGTLSVSGFDLKLRSPNSHDFAAAARAPDVAQAQAVLLQRLVTARRAGKEVDSARLPTRVLAALEKRMAELDSQDEILLDMTCPACAQSWQAALEIGEFLWAEVQTTAQRLLGEVHLLASSYGWSELEILALSSVRRRAYLAQVMA